jgi:alpha-D-xyloside xylohydrolase
MLTAIAPKSRKIDRVERNGNALFLYSKHGTMRIEPKSGSIVRVTYTVQDTFSEVKKPGVTCEDVFGDWTFDNGPDLAIEVKLPGLTVSVNRCDGSVRYYDNTGKLLFAEGADEPREFEEFETFHLAGVPQKTRMIDTADGKKEVLEDALKVSTGKSFHIRYHFNLGDEAVYGFGQQEKGCASLRGKRLYIHQGNRKIAVPFFVSTAGYGILTDCYSPLIFNDNENGTYLYTESAQESDIYFIAGSMNEVVKGYRSLTGKAALLPRWAFGYVQSKERYETQEQILDTVKKSRELGIGMDCIVLDWISWPDGEWGQKSYDPARFPAPKEMIDKLHEDHVHFMISLWPTMAGNTPDHKEFADRDLFLPGCSVYDAFKEEARKLYFDQLKRTHFSYGTDAWWCDSSEPFTPEWNHRVRPEESDLYKDFCEEAGLRMPYEYCNSYPLFHAMGIYENQRISMEESGCDKRVVNLTRSAYTGQQRFGTVMWSGDTDASWETYRDQIAIGLHFSASGLPYWTMDTGAFFVKRGEYWYWNGKYDNTVEDPAYQELYTRWYQYAAFLPMFRAHGTDFDREMWNFTGEFYDAMLKANRLRYSLMPYIYSEAGKVWLEDRSLIRWLAFDFTGDRRTWDITDQFMFGENMMVCPVTSPMYYGVSQQEAASAGVRKVYFPAGCNWFDFYTGEKYEGGTECEVSAELDKIPLFVKEGSLIPVRKPALSTEEQADETEWKKFGEGKASYELYEDDGDGYGYEEGKYTVTVIEM